MIYTLQKWPDVLTTVIQLYTDSREIVLYDSTDGFVLCLADKYVLLPFQNAFTQFYSQPTSIRNLTGTALFDYTYMVVNLDTFIVKLATEIHTSKIVEATMDNNAFTQEQLDSFEPHVNRMVSLWMLSVMEFHPLNQDEKCCVHMLDRTAP